MICFDFASMDPWETYFRHYSTDYSYEHIIKLVQCITIESYIYLMGYYPPFWEGFE